MSVWRCRALKEPTSNDAPSPGVPPSILTKSAAELPHEQALAELESLRAENAALAEKLKDVETTWALVFDVVPTVAAVLRGDAEVDALNRHGLDEAGLQPSQAIGRKIDAIGPGEPWQAFRRLFDRKEKSVQAVAHDIERGRVWSVSVHRLDGLEPLRWLVRANDTTEVVGLKAELRNTQRAAELGNFVAGVAHEVRNPLFGILANLDAWAEEFDEGYKVFGSRIRKEANRLRQLMSDLMDFGRPGPLSIAPVCLNGVAKAAFESCSEAARQRRVTLVNQLGEDLPLVHGDARRLEQAIRNLVENAVQFSPSGASVWLEGGAEERLAWIRVSDSGSGFAIEDLDRIFQPFFTRRPEGTGLGLALVRRIAEDHQGRVTAGNHTGGGAWVRIELPNLPAVP